MGRRMSAHWWFYGVFGGGHPVLRACHFSGKPSTTRLSEGEESIKTNVRTRHAVYAREVQFHAVRSRVSGGWFPELPPQLRCSPLFVERGAVLFIFARKNIVPL